MQGRSLEEALALALDKRLFIICWAELLGGRVPNREPLSARLPHSLWHYHRKGGETLKHAPGTVYS